MRFVAVLKKSWMRNASLRGNQVRANGSPFVSNRAKAIDETRREAFCLLYLRDVARGCGRGIGGGRRAAYKPRVWNAVKKSSASG
jgi:hypothetical protein